MCSSYGGRCLELGSLLEGSQPSDQSCSLLFSPSRERDCVRELARVTTFHVPAFHKESYVGSLARSLAYTMERSFVKNHVIGRPAPSSLRL